MQIVTDSGIDLSLTPEQMKSLKISIVPLRVSLEGKSYREGIDISNDDFYELLTASREMPVTSQPSPGDFVAAYKRLAALDPEILSIHMSSGLSGTYNSAVMGAQLVPDARVTHVDTKTLSAPAGWQVLAAAQAIRAGWQKPKILDLIERVGMATSALFTLNELKYLINGGRISHMKGLMASVLNIKPIIGVEKEKGTYVQIGFLRTFKKAVAGVVDVIERKHEGGSALRIQIVHARNIEGANDLQQQLAQRFKCAFLPTMPLSLVLGAHTGPSMIGVAYAPASTFAELPA